jgi:hypothetical protein
LELTAQLLLGRQALYVNRVLSLSENTLDMMSLSDMDGLYANFFGRVLVRFMLPLRDFCMPLKVTVDRFGSSPSSCHSTRLSFRKAQLLPAMTALGVSIDRHKGADESQVVTGSSAGVI